MVTSYSTGMVDFQRNATALFYYFDRQTVFPHFRQKFKRAKTFFGTVFISVP